MSYRYVVVSFIAIFAHNRGKSTPWLTCFGFVNTLEQQIGERYRISEKMQKLFGKTALRAQQTSLIPSSATDSWISCETAAGSVPARCGCAGSARVCQRPACARARPPLSV
jgi:hypothetical protein